jgi:hypothetical protein
MDRRPKISGATGNVAVADLEMMVLQPYTDAARELEQSSP